MGLQPCLCNRRAYKETSLGKRVAQQRQAAAQPQEQEDIIDASKYKTKLPTYNRDRAALDR